MSKDLKPAAADSFIQWKGTNVCMDFHCYRCDAFSHMDADFAYVVKCVRCGQLYEMPSVVALKPVETTDLCIVNAVADDDESSSTMGWKAPIPLRTVTYHSDD